MRSIKLIVFLTLCFVCWINNFSAAGMLNYPGAAETNEGHQPAQQTSPSLRLEYVGHCLLKGNSRAVDIYKHFAYVALNDKGLAIVDISTPEKARLVRYIDQGWWPLHLSINGNICIIADRFKGLRILDLTQPESPRQIKTFSVPGIANYVVERGDLLFIACGAQGLMVARKGPGFKIEVLGQFTEVDYTKMVLLKENMAFLADNRDRGFKILDISNPSAPGLLEAYDIKGFCDVLARRGNLVFIGHRRWGVMITDISQVSKPRVLAKIIKKNNALKDLKVQGDLLFTADNENGVHLYDITNPEQPQLVDEYDTDGQAVRLTVRNNYVYVADWTNGLVILRLKYETKSLGQGHNPLSSPDKSQLIDR